MVTGHQLDKLDTGVAARRSIRHPVKILFSTRLGVRSIVINALVAFGLLSGIIQFAAVLWNLDFIQNNSLLFLLLILCLAVAIGIGRSWPRMSITQEFRRPAFRVTVEVGDHLTYRDHHIVVGFTDTFDTDIRDDIIISSRSVQGRFLLTHFNGDAARLDKEIESALAAISPTRSEPHGAKLGKLDRYPIGTVAVMGTPQRRTFGLAYGVLSNELVASSNLNYIWESLNKLWDSVFTYSQNGSVAIPVIGSNFARMISLDYQSLVKVIILSFVARSRERPICSALTVVVWPPDQEKADFLDLSWFIRSI